MDYKKLIRKRETRLKLLRLLDFVPDKTMIELQYRIKTGRKLNLKNPKRYTEKLQWYKLYYRDPLMAVCSDKLRVRDYVAEKGLESILNRLIDVYERPEDIDFETLPESFVLKSTSGGGGSSVLICRSRDDLDVKETINTIRWWQSKQSKGGREWVYYYYDTRIIAEDYISSPKDDLVDYKFFCFNGEPRFLYVINNRRLGDAASLGIFDVSYKQLPYFRGDERKMNDSPEKPVHFDQMLEISRVLSKDFPHVRVDLYDEERVIFGEMTFFDGSGYQPYIPDEFDSILGDCFELPSLKPSIPKL